MAAHLKSGAQFVVDGTLDEAKSKIWPDEDAKPFTHFVGGRT